MKPLIIGIAGKSGSGKTTVAYEIFANFNQEDVIVIKFDDYYKKQDHLDFATRTKTNYDHPNAFDWDLLIQDMAALANNQTIHKPIYDFANHTRAQEVDIIHPAKVIILEGILVLLEEKLRQLLDVKIFVDTDDDECIIRRILRDTKERGRSLDSVIEQYLNSVKPMALQFIEPSKKYADFIIPRGGNNTIAISMICNQIRAMLKKAVH